MAIRVCCENLACAKTIDVDDEHAGKLVECPECGHSQTLPAATSAVPDSSSRAQPESPLALRAQALTWVSYLLKAITIDRVWRGNGARSLPAVCVKVLDVDRVVLTYTCATSILLGLLMTTHILQVYTGPNNREVGQLLLLLPLPAYALGFFFHRLVRKPNRYYVSLAIVYPPFAWGSYIVLALMLLDFLVFNEPSARGSSATAAPQIAFAGGFLCYLVIVFCLSLRCVYSDMRAGYLPPGSISFGFGVVLTLIATLLCVRAFYHFLTDSAHSPYLTNFFLNGLLTCAFSVPAYFLSQRAARLERQAGPLKTVVPGTPPLPSPMAAGVATIPFRVSRRGIVIAAVGCEFLLMVMSLSQQRPERFGVTEIVRTAELRIRPGGEELVASQNAQECILWFRLKGIPLREFDDISSQITMGDQNRPALVQITSSRAPLGKPLERIYLAFLIPQSEAFPKLQLGENRSIAFKLPATLVAQYDATVSNAFPLQWLVLLFPVFCVAAYLIAPKIMSRLREPTA